MTYGGCGPAKKVVQARQGIVQEFGFPADHLPGPIGDPEDKQARQSQAVCNRALFLLGHLEDRLATARFAEAVDRNYRSLGCSSGQSGANAGGRQERIVLAFFSGSFACHSQKTSPTKLGTRKWCAFTRS